MAWGDGQPMTSGDGCMGVSTTCMAASGCCAGLSALFSLPLRMRADTVGASWDSQAAPAAWPARHSFGSVGLSSGALVIAGGRNNTVDDPLGDVWTSSVS